VRGTTPRVTSRLRRSRHFDPEIPMSPFEVRTLPIDQLQPAAYNPRKPLGPKSSAYRKLKASLAEFGLVEPLVWNERTGRVVGGHARLRILRELGVTEVPVSVVRLDEAREKALNIVLNNQEAQGRYDPAKLADLLTELQALPELALTGFDETTLAALRLEPAPDLPPAAGDPDRVEITLVTDAATYAELAPRLDEVVGAFDLVAHVRRG
jgi:ParB-like chromosome segregation protein Spo0J